MYGLSDFQEYAVYSDYLPTGKIGSVDHANNTATTYTYDNEDHVHAVSGINRNDIDHAYAYDANGNMTGGPDFTDPSQTGTRTIAYNGDNMPVQMEQVKGGNTILMDLVYDGTGGRAKKIVSGAAVSTSYYIGEHYEIKDDTATKFIFAGNMRIAMVSTSGTLYFHKDHLGSSTVITDANGVEVETTLYMPFGATRSHTGTDTSNYKFTDQELDPESGLYNYGARLYDPVIGRFISADTIVPDFSSPQTLNRYSYCYNNPLIYIDPNGNFGFIAAIVGAVIGAVISGIQSDWNPQAMLVGAVIGGVSGGMYSEVSGYVSGSANTYLTSVGISSTTSGIISGAAGGAAGGAAAGAVAGGMSAAYYGGEIGDAMLRGAGLGGLGGAAFGGIGGYFGDTWDLWRVGAYTLGGGGMGELSGQGFETGAIFALATSIAAWTYHQVVGEAPNSEPGTKLVRKEPNEMSYQDSSNVGKAVRPNYNVKRGRRFQSNLTGHIMPRQPRLDAPGALHHVMGRGIESINIFRNNTDREDFLARLEDLCHLEALKIYAWALLDISTCWQEPEKNLSRSI